MEKRVGLILALVIALVPLIGATVDFTSDNESNQEISEVKPLLKTSINNETLKIANIGSTNFNETITVDLGNYKIVRKRTLKPEEAITINLRLEVKPGVYNIKILPTNELFQNVVVLKDDNYLFVNYLRYVFILALIFVFCYCVNKAVKFYKNREDEYIEVREDKRKYIIEPSRKPKFKFGKNKKEEFFVIGKGDKPKPPENEGGGIMGMFD